MLPKFTAREREFFRKMGSDQTDSGRMNSFSRAWKVGILPIAFLGAAGLLLLFLWLR
jgi:hypothetical protein